MTKKVTMYATGWCPYCRQAELLLLSKGVSDLTKIDVDAIPGGRHVMTGRTGRTSVPQIFIGDRHVGGFTDLAALDDAGQLEELLGLHRRG